MTLASFLRFHGIALMISACQPSNMRHRKAFSRYGVWTHLDDFGVDVALLAGALQNGLLYGPGRRQHQHQHRLALPYAVRPIPCLPQRNSFSF